VKPFNTLQTDNYRMETTETALTILKLGLVKLIPVAGHEGP
jgi:hypothetical protein